MTTIKLNEGQLNAITVLNEWLENDENHLPITLSGYAGTGKSFTISYWLTQQSKYPLASCALVAPTHKAKKVLASAVEDFFYCQGLEPWYIQRYSLHSFLGIGMNADEDTGKLKANSSSSGVPPAQLTKLAIIDECGMIGEELFSELEPYFFTCRIIFLGDILQLTPIEGNSKEFALSPSFRRTSDIIYLKQVMRNKGLISAFCAQYRASIEQNLPALTPLRAYIQAAKNSGDYLVSGGFEFCNHSLRMLDSLDASEYQYLASKNSTVDEIIKLCRKDRNDVIEAGESLMLYSPLKIKHGIQDFMLPNSTELKVLHVEKLERIDRRNLGGISEVTPALWKLLSKDARNILVRTEDGLEFNLEYFPHLAEFDKVLSKFAKAKVISWRKHYYPFMEGQLVAKHTYALTIHKSQGSTYNYIGIINDMDWAIKQPNQLYNRLMYVAISRAKEKIKFMEY